MFYLNIYYVVLNGMLFILMGADKLFAISHKYRVKEATLLSLSLLGGSVGGFFGMLIFHHKIRKHYFFVVFLLSTITHMVLYLNLKLK
ncbi:MAG: DUF1294 domain-containing protein [Anaerotignaceae bacterium]